MKEATLKMLYIIWFRLRDIQEKAKLQGQNKSMVTRGLEWMRGLTTKGNVSGEKTVVCADHSSN